MLCHYHAIFSKFLQKTHHSSPVRARYGVSILDPIFALYSASVTVVMYAISSYIGQIIMVLNCTYYCSLLLDLRVTNFSAISVKKKNMLSFKETHLNMSSAKWQTSFLNISVSWCLKFCWPQIISQSDKVDRQMNIKTRFFIILRWDTFMIINCIHISDNNLVWKTWWIYWLVISISQPV